MLLEYLSDSIDGLITYHCVPRVHGFLLVPNWTGFIETDMHIRMHNHIHIIIRISREKIGVTPPSLRVLRVFFYKSRGW